MFRHQKNIATRMTMLLVGLGAAGAALTAGATGSAAEPVRCEITTSMEDGATRLEGVVHADTAVDGSYRFRVKSGGASGNSNIDQSGDFSAGPNDPATVGTVTLGGSDANYDAHLTVTVNGKKTECTDRQGAT